ncbi:MAG: molecular chaperone HtpG [Oscillospiraceae bacterium]|jgi:molecular chaperone HtpG|nr:molecular chaperone HtpG [Oscillospiraceae bacterium]
MAKRQFKSESKRILDLMIGSIYTHREIFLRELISNASDAIDKLCYIALTDDKLGLTREDFKIEITRDPEARTLTVSDNGVGMTAEDLESNLGVIARSGSLKFKNQLSADGAQDKASSGIDIIGQFGVGFYSAFMVAKKVTVISRAYGSDSANMWESSGSDGYVISPAERAAFGTDVIMQLKDDAEDDGYSEFLEEHTLYSLIKKYSDYIRWPIIMDVTRSRRVEADPQESGKSDKPESKSKWESYTERETVNSRIPIWQRPKSEATDEDCNEFFKEQFDAEEDPAAVIRVAAEGAAVSYKAMLFVPSAAPYDYFTREYEPGLRLYASGVLIMEKCASLLPEYFRFVRGVVDSADLSLNISRETLQHDRQLKTIAANLEKKVRAELERLLENDRAGYAKFYEAFGLQLKYGLLSDYGAHAEKLRGLLLFYSAREAGLITLAEYVKNMPEEQKFIYYACGSGIAALDKLPQAEPLRERGYDVLYLTDDIDDFAARALGEYEGRQLRSVTGDDLGIADEAERRELEKTEQESRELLDFVKESLDGKISEARLSATLVSAPVCLTAKGGVTLEMERYFNTLKSVSPAASPAPVRAERVLELNASHRLFELLKNAYESDRERAAKYAELLYGQALLTAGLELDDAARFCGIISELTA